MKKFISLIMIISVFLGCKFDIYASEKVKFKNEKVEFVVISSEMTEVGKIYYVRRENTFQTYSFWDILDIAMAGYSWSEYLGDPSWGNFGWAVLDTAALLPLIPSTSYVRKGSKVLLKSDEFARFAKTNAGRKIIKSVIKTYNYSKISDGLNFTVTTAKHMRNPDRFVPVHTLRDAILGGIKRNDPRGTPAKMCYTIMYKNGKKYNLEVLYNFLDNRIYHFQYSQKALGPLPRIR